MTDEEIIKAIFALRRLESVRRFREEGFTWLTDLPEDVDKVIAYTRYLQDEKNKQEGK